MPIERVVTAIADPAIYAAALITVIAAVVGGSVQVINAYSSARDRRYAAQERQIALEQSAAGIELAKVNSQKADAIMAKTTAVEALANGTNSNLQRAIDVLTERLAGQDQIIKQLQQAKDETAAVRSTTDQQIATALQSLPPGSVIIPPKVEPAVDLVEMLEHDRRNRKTAQLALALQIEELTKRMAAMQDTVAPAKTEVPK